VRPSEREPGECVGARGGAERVTSDGGVTMQKSGANWSREHDDGVLVARFEKGTDFDA